MGSDTAGKPLNCDEIFMHHRLHFANTLKDLKNLRQQLYSAAEYFETSYNGDDHKQSVMETSKDYLSKAVVSTVDHLGSVADKLGKFLDDKAAEFASANTRFYCIQELFDTLQELVDLRGVSRHSLPSEGRKHHKQYNSPGAHKSYFRKSNLVYEDCVPCYPNDAKQSTQDNPFVKGFQVAVLKPQPPQIRNIDRKRELRSFSSEHPHGPVNLSYARVQSNKESGKSLDSTPRFTLRRSGSAAYRSVSPTSSTYKHQVEATLSEARRSNIIAACIKPETTNKERQIIAYPKRSKNLLKALLSLHHSRKETTSNP